MRFFRAFRILTLALMALSLLVVLARPEVLPALWKMLIWIVPLWIGLLYAVQALVTPDADGVSPLEALRSRWRGETWTCPGCGEAVPRHVAICIDCGELRPEPAWTCEVCESENAPGNLVCERCKVPRPGGGE